MGEASAGVPANLFKIGVRRMIRALGFSLVLSALCLVSAGCAQSKLVAADSLVFHASTQWVQQTPGHESRRLQFSIPSHREGVEDASLIVWNFRSMRDRGDGFVIQKNIDRWCEQFVHDDGTPLTRAAEVTEFRINQMPVYTVDLHGRFVAETSPGSDLYHDKPGYRMLGAYIVAPHGDYIVKMVGPASVIDRHAKAFDTFMRSVQPRDGSMDIRDFQDPSTPKIGLAAERGRW